LHRPNIKYWLEIPSGENGGYQDMEQGLQLVVVFLAALATGGLVVNWTGLGRAMSRPIGNSKKICWSVKNC
jgi:hypothetical protein